MPCNYNEWISSRAEHLENNLKRSEFTEDLYKQYRKRLGWVRFEILKQVQITTLPQAVKQLLYPTGTMRGLINIARVYKLFRSFKLDSTVKSMLLPPEYKLEIENLHKNKL